MSTLTFHQALLQAEAQARSTLEVALHERLSAAVALVIKGKVFQTSTGLWQVDSSSRSGVAYSPNGTCKCDDHHFNRPRYCKHQLAMFLAQRTMTLMRQPAAPVVPELVEPWPDNDPAPAPQSPPVEPAPSPAPGLPEAPASANCHIMIEGRQVQVTLRDTDESRLLQRLTTLLKQYPGQAPVSPPASQGPPQGQGKDWCARPQVAMKWNAGKDGRKGWHSHRLADGTWCKGK